MAFASLPIDEEIAVAADPRHPLAKKLPKLLIGISFTRWLSGLRAEVDARPKRDVHVRRASNSAAIATTALAIDTVHAGVWRVSVQVRVVTPATTSSEVRATISWTQGGVTQTQTTANLVGNLTTTREGLTVVLRATQGTPVSYAASYSSVGATAMVYELDVVAEQLGIDAT